MIIVFRHCASRRKLRNTAFPILSIAKMPSAAILGWWGAVEGYLGHMAGVHQHEVYQTQTQAKRKHAKTLRSVRYKVKCREKSEAPSIDPKYSDKEKKNPQPLIEISSNNKLRLI